MTILIAIQMIGQYDADGMEVVKTVGGLVTEERNRTILERRRAGDTVSAIAKDFGISGPRVRQICEREERRDGRRRELAEAEGRADQPNPLFLEPRLRTKLADICGKIDFTPRDIEALEFTRANFSRLGLEDSEWRALMKWMERAGIHPVAPHRMTIGEWLEYEARRSGEES